jgi:hypothetical protein
MAELDAQLRRRLSSDFGGSGLVFAGLAVVTGIGHWLSPGPGAGWLEPVGFGLLAMFLLGFHVGMRGEQRAAAAALAQLQALVEEKARLQAEAARPAQEAEQVRERLEAEVHSLRLAYEELRRQQLARPPSQAGRAEPGAAPDRPRD